MKAEGVLCLIGSTASKAASLSTGPVASLIAVEESIRIIGYASTFMAPAHLNLHFLTNQLLIINTGAAIFPDSFDTLVDVQIKTSSV